MQYPDATVVLTQLDAVGNRVGERKTSTATALTAAAFLLLPTAALSSDVVASFNRVDELESVVDSRAPAKNASFTWDAAGNLKRQQSAARDRRFDWDIKQTLTRVVDNGLEAGRYDYAASGLRTKRRTALEAVEYVLDGDEVLLEADASAPGHPATRRYTFGASALAVTDITGSTRTTRALHLDALGSPSTETSLAAAPLVNRQYDAWGAYRNGSAPTEVDAKLGFTGHQYDVEAGLTYARARYYDAEFGRFLSRDSVEGSLSDAPSLHRFAYARVNPLRYTDRNGHCPQSMIEKGQFAACAEWELRRAIAQHQREGEVTSEMLLGPLAGVKTLGQCVFGRSRGSCRDVTTTASWSPSEIERGAEDFKNDWVRRYEAVNGDDPIAAGQARADFEAAATQVALVLVGGVEAAAEESAMSPKAERLGQRAARRASGPWEEFSAEEGAVACTSEFVCAGPSCFVAGTPVETLSGKIAIERIEVGDFVLSRNDSTGEVGWKRVLQTFKTEGRQVLRLILVDESGAQSDITTTPTHPFWVDGQGWTPAGNLAEDMRVASAKGTWLRVGSVTWLTEGATVYNFEVADWHTYFAGDASAWVHNIGKPCPGAGEAVSEELARSKWDLQFSSDLTAPTPDQQANWNVRLRRFDPEAGRLRNESGQFTADPENPRSPYKFTDSQRRAAWRELAADPESPLSRTQRHEVEARGWRGPQRVNPLTGELETMELSHEPVPLREGGTEVVPRWPEDHAAIDPFRHLKKR